MGEVIAMKRTQWQVGMVGARGLFLTGCDAAVRGRPIAVDG